jgi:hypothetical protein
MFGSKKKEEKKEVKPVETKQIDLNETCNRVNILIILSYS